MDVKLLILVKFAFDTVIGDVKLRVKLLFAPLIVLVNVKVEPVNVELPPKVTPLL